MAWTDISKPSSQTYTNANPQGKEQYDEPSLTYDDVSVFYDGVNPSQYTGISKPTSSVWTNISKPT
jgi:capsule polysaccharide export protein KpsC/LpsZ